MIKSLVFALAGLTWLVTACGPQPVSDPGKVTLQLADLPEGSKTQGAVLKITPENMKALHSKKKISDLVLQELEKLEFESLVSRTFQLPGEREIASQVFIFKDEEEASRYFRMNPPDFPGKDTELLGDESFTEAILPPQSNDPEAARLHSLRTRIRIGRIISDFSESAPEVNREEHLRIAKKAEARLKAADQ